MTVNVSIFYQRSGVNPSTVYYSNTRHPFCMNIALLHLGKYKASVLHELSLTFFKAYFTFEKKFQTLQNIGAFLLNMHLMKFF